MRSVRGAAVDTGGMESTTATTTVRVDCTAPTLTLATGPPEVLEGDVVEPPAAQAVDAASGVASTTMELSIDGSAWVAGAARPVAEAGRTYVFRVRAVDAAGNTSAWRTSDPVVGVTRPEPVAPAEEPGIEAPRAELPPLADAEPAAGAVAPLELLAEPVVPTLHAKPKEPGLRVVRVWRRRGIVRIAGTAAADLTTLARVTLRAGRKTVRRTVAVKAGRWRARFRLAKGSRASEVAVITPPTPTHAAGTARWKAPRTRLQPLR